MGTIITILVLLYLYGHGMDRWSAWCVDHDPKCKTVKVGIMGLVWLLIAFLVFVFLEAIITGR